MTDEPMVAASDLADALEWLSLGAEHWDAERVLREGLDLVLATTGADACQLFAVGDEVAFQVAARPGPVLSIDAGVPSTWFPWGLAAVRPRRFLFIADAGPLTDAPDTAPSNDGGSALHLPIIERQRVMGAMHLRWRHPHTCWDDRDGPLLRLLARYLLGRSLAAQSGDPNRRIARRSEDSGGSDPAAPRRVSSDSMTSWRSR